MQPKIRKIARSLLGLTLVITWFVYPLSDSPASAVHIVASRQGEILYQLTADLGDSISRMMRLAILVYTLEYPGEQYSFEQLIASETSLTDLFGRRWVRIGEQLTVSSRQIAEALAATERLASKQLAAWTPYSQKVDYQMALQTASSIFQNDLVQNSNDTPLPLVSDVPVPVSAGGESMIWWLVASIESLFVIWLIFKP